MKQIMVVERNALFADKFFEGYLAADAFDFESVILSNYIWMSKDKAEINPDYKQPVGYSIIYNPALKQVFLYQRAKVDQNYAEKRLQGKWSCGVGGHIEKIDTKQGNPIHESSLREIEEEIKIFGKKRMQTLGYINDDSDEVGKVHFGILYLVMINGEKVEPIDPEISAGGLVPLRALEEKCNATDVIVENWSKIALGPLKSI